MATENSAFHLRNKLHFKIYSNNNNNKKKKKIICINSFPVSVFEKKLPASVFEKSCQPAFLLIFTKI